MAAAPLVLAGREYVVLPREEYLRLVIRSSRARGDDEGGLEVSGAGGASQGCDVAGAREANLAVRVRAARRRAGLTQVALAERLGVTQSTICNVEAGRTRIGRVFLESVLDVCRPAELRRSRSARAG